MSGPRADNEYERKVWARFLARMAARGYEVLDGYVPDAIEWCWAGCDCEPERGRDSYGDCADCGEPVVWVRRVFVSVAPASQPTREVD